MSSSMDKGPQKGSPQTTVNFRIRKSNDSSVAKYRKSKSGPILKPNSQNLFKKKKVKLQISKFHKTSDIKLEIVSRNMSNICARKRDACNQSINDCDMESKESVVTKKREGNSQSILNMLESIAEGQKQILSLMRKEFALQREAQESLINRNATENLSQQKQDEKIQNQLEIPVPIQRKSSQKDSYRNFRIRRQYSCKSLKSNFPPQSHKQLQNFQILIPSLIQQILKKGHSYHSSQFQNSQRSLLNLRELLTNRFVYHHKTYSDFVKRILKYQKEHICQLELQELLSATPFKLQQNLIQFLLKQLSKIKQNQIQQQTRFKISIHIQTKEQIVPKQSEQQSNNVNKYSMENVINFFRQLLPTTVKYTSDQITHLLHNFYQKFNLVADPILYGLQKYENQDGTVRLIYFERVLLEENSIYFEEKEIEVIKMLACVHSKTIQKIEYMETFSALKKKMLKLTHSHFK